MRKMSGWVIEAGGRFIGPFYDASDAGRHLDRHYNNLASPRLVPLYEPDESETVTKPPNLDDDIPF